jgi:hypothetical protein
MKYCGLFRRAINFIDLLVTAVIGLENSSVISYNAVIRISATGSVPVPTFCTSSSKNWFVNSN